MNDAYIPNTGWRQHAFTLALIACFIRALIPVGFMPDASAPGHMTICAGVESQKTVNFDPTQKPASKTQHDVCPFAVNTAGLADSPSIIPAPAIDTAPPILPDAADLVSASSSPYASRAPPVSLTV